MENVAEACGNFKAALEALADSDISSTARLVAALEACGVTDRETLERLTGSKPSTLREARRALKIQRQKSSAADTSDGNPAPEIQRCDGNPALAMEIQRWKSSALARAHKEYPSGINNSKTNSQSDRQVEQEPPREVGCKTDNFQNCKTAFNGTTDAMLAEVERAMGPLGDRRGAETWLATLLSINGADPVSQAFAMLATARAEGKPIVRVLPWWSKTAATLKAKPKDAPRPRQHSDDPYFIAKVTTMKNVRPAPGSEWCPELTNA